MAIAWRFEGSAVLALTTALLGLDEIRRPVKKCRFLENTCPTSRRGKNWLPEWMCSVLRDKRVAEAKQQLLAH